MKESIKKFYYENSLIKDLKMIKSLKVPKIKKMENLKRFKMRVSNSYL